MNKKFIDDMIPVAIESIEKNGIAVDGVVPSPYNGYIASFATSVVRAGIRQSVIFFCNEEANTRENRAQMMLVLQEVLQQGNKMPSNTSLVDFVNQAGTEELHRFKTDIMDAAVACKMALRTFKKAEPQNE